MPASEAWPRPKLRYIKTFTAVWDVPEDGCEGAVVRGSHRLLAMPQEMLAVNFRGDNTKGYLAFGDTDLPQASIVSIHPLRSCFVGKVTILLSHNVARLCADDAARRLPMLL